ncbi:MAG: hypothetical protein WBD86_01905 [Microgenomates group bacterium]
MELKKEEKPPSRFKSVSEIVSGAKFVVGPRFGHSATVIGRNPVSPNVHLDREILKDTLAIKLKDTVKMSSSRLQLMFGKDSPGLIKGNFFVENLSTLIPLRVSGSLQGERLLEPGEKLPLGTRIDSLGGLQIQWGDKQGVVSHILQVDSYGDSHPEGNWRAAFKYTTESRV